MGSEKKLKLLGIFTYLASAPLQLHKTKDKKCSKGMGVGDEVVKSRDAGSFDLAGIEYNFIPN